MDNTNTTQQVVKHVPNPSGKGGFGENPENRNPGGWKKEESISYQYNRLMRLSPAEVRTFKPETMAQAIALKRILNALKDKGLPDAKEIADRTEGKAAQPVELDGKLSVTVNTVSYADADTTS